MDSYVSKNGEITSKDALIDNVIARNADWLKGLSSD